VSITPAKRELYSPSSGTFETNSLGDDFSPGLVRINLVVGSSLTSEVWPNALKLIVALVLGYE
jgi:hypothetical protein